MVKLPVYQGQKNPMWYEQGLRFECTGCGNCCTGAPGVIWISDEEIRRAAEHLKISVDQFVKQYCHSLDGRVSLKEKSPNSHGEYDCIFLHELEPAVDENGRMQRRRICEIYPVRPLQCRLFPFWPGVLQSRRVWDSVARGCPGMNQGKEWTIEEITARRDATQWPVDK